LVFQTRRINPTPAVHPGYVITRYTTWFRARSMLLGSLLPLQNDLDQFWVIRPVRLPTSNSTP
jgi:hypothetical protein